MRKSVIVSRRRGASVRPYMELLEDRTLLDASGSVPSFPFDWDANDYVADHIIVRFRDDVNPGLVAGAVPGTELGERTLLDGHNIFTVALPQNLTVTQAIAAYQANPNVLYAEPDYIVHATLAPDDPRFTDGTLWAMNNTGQNGGTADADIDAVEAWDLTTGSNSVVIAVIDTGVNYNHPDLAANLWVNPNETPGNGVDDDANGYVDDIYGINAILNNGNPLDDNGHGTHVSGTIGGVGNNGVGVVGVNWNVKIMALKFLSAAGSGSISDALECLNYAVARGVTVSSNSWGGGGFSQAFSDGLTAARTASHIFVAAAGNSGTNGASYPAAYTHDNIIAVAATDRNDNLASFSQYGNNVDLGAPGVAIYSTYGSGYASLNGTSMATPHVGGAVAFLKAYNPTLTYQEYINAILSTVDPKASLAGKVVTGGRLNLFKAADSITPLPPPPPPPSGSGPFVVSMTPSGNVAGPIPSIQIEFNELVDASTFNKDKIVQFGGPLGVDLFDEISSITPNSGAATVFTIQFTPQSNFGTYTIVLGRGSGGAWIRDTDGSEMNQDQDLNNGENPQDLFTGSFSIGDATGPTVLSHSPTGTIIGPVNNIQVNFNELINATTFTIADVTSFTGPGGIDLSSELLAVSPSSGSATSFFITFADQTLPGDYSLTFGPDILDLSGNLMDQDVDGTAGELADDQYSANFTVSPSQRNTYDANDLPKAIKDLRTINSKITVPDGLTIEDIDVKLYITHTWDSDLRIQLKSPKGTTITFVNYRGGAGDNFGSNTLFTVLDDEATAAISSGFAPFIGSFRPETNGQLTKFDGQEAKGTWTLSVYDRANQDTGFLNKFSLVITGQPSGAGGFRRSFVSSSGTLPVSLLQPSGKQTPSGTKSTRGSVEKTAANLGITTLANSKAADSLFAAVELGSRKRVYIPTSADGTLKDLAASLTL